MKKLEEVAEALRKAMGNDCVRLERVCFSDEVCVLSPCPCAKAIAKAAIEELMKVDEGMEEVLFLEGYQAMLKHVLEE